MIKEAYCSLKVTMYLREKGFEHPNDDKENCPAITHQLAMTWLREVYNLHITIMFSKYLYGSYPFFWDIDGMIDDKREKTSTDTGDYSYKSYEEAVEAAIKYCLENLV